MDRFPRSKDRQKIWVRLLLWNVIEKDENEEVHQVWQQKNGINFGKMPGNLLFVSYWICLGCVTFWKILVTNEENIALISESFIWNHISHAVEFGIYWFVLRVLRSVDFRSMPHDSTLFDWRYADPQLCVACEMFHNKINENLVVTYCFRWWSHISSVWTQTGIYFIRQHY
jgi:hypothetical protein